MVKMKKLLGIIFLSFFWCNVGLAKDLTLYCKQEVREISKTDSILKEKIPIKQLWQILIKDKKIEILEPPKLTKYKFLKRRKSIENYDTFFASTGWVLNNENMVKYSQEIKINRSTGEGEVRTFDREEGFNVPVVYDIIKCSKEKPKLLF